ncbi:MAG: SDR family oxidoreductase [Gammaproteobacteria bacterium]
MTETVLITGASSGFGEACAKKFAQPGYQLLLTARRLDRLENLAAELRGKCPVQVAKLDVTEAGSIASFSNTLPADFKAVDILINNAGLALGLEPAQEAFLDDWETMIDTNIKGLIRMTRSVLPGMVERNHGHIINIASVAGSWPYPGGNAYGASKAFVQQFSRNLRCDLLGKHIRVTNIDPGMAETEFSNVRMKGDTEKADKVYENTQPLSATDIADIIYWVTTVPAHVNINTLEVMPVCQAWSAFAIDRKMND